MDKYVKLLKTWCDELINLQIRGYGKYMDGGFLCRACTAVHGRADNAVFPFMFMYRFTGDKKYYEAAKLVFEWQGRLLNPDGSVYNDGNNFWKAISTFSIIEYCKALEHYENIMEKDFAEEIDRRVKGMAEWTYNTITTDYKANINYMAATAAAMAYCYARYNDSRYESKSREMTKYCLEHFTENGLLVGEGQPHKITTAKGCMAIDIGYDIEESLPCLIDAALLLKDTETEKILAGYMTDMLELMLPDGGWDNSFGSRNNKWTYYGSRTSDGCIASYLALAKYNPNFYEAAVRNADLLIKCTDDGLLYGGPDYKKVGEPACTHHAFCHAAGLADAILNGLKEDLPRGVLPCDQGKFAVKHYPEADTYVIRAGKFSATVTGTDYGTRLNHASGGVISMLSHVDFGPIIAASTYTYYFSEPLNMQVSKENFPHRTLIPRVEAISKNTIYNNCFDYNSKIEAAVSDDSVVVTAYSTLCDQNGGTPQNNSNVKSVYTFTNDKILIKINIEDNADLKPNLILPIIGENSVLKTDNSYQSEYIFFLSGGFKANEYTISPDSNGEIELTITVQ